MARPKVDPIVRRTSFISAAVSPLLSYQVQLVARIKGCNVAQLIEGAMLELVRNTPMPGPNGTGITLQGWGVEQLRLRSQGSEAELKEWTRVVSDLDAWRFMDPTDPLTGEPLPVPKVSDEVVLWDESEAVRWFRLAFLVPSLLSDQEKEVLHAIRLNNVKTYKLGRGITSYDNGQSQAVLEPYIIKHWELIQAVIAGKRPLSSLPNECEVINQRSK